MQKNAVNSKALPSVQSAVSVRKNIYTALTGNSWWNLYFLLVLPLAAASVIQFNPTANVLLLCFLLLPTCRLLLHRFRQLTATAAGLLLLYTEFDRSPDGVPAAMMQVIEKMSFSELLDSLYAAEALLLLVLLFVIQMFWWLRRRLRFNSISALIVLMLSLVPPLHSWINSLSLSWQQGLQNMQMAEAQRTMPGLVAQEGPATAENIARWLQDFYRFEADRRAELPASLPDGFTSFDIILLNICSLSTADLEEIGLTDHPIFADADITFSAFNSATSYSGPSTLRLLRSVCGQSSHSDLYTLNSSCELVSNLERLGFHSNLLMDHSGAFGNYLQGLRSYAGFTAPLASQSSYKVRYRSFDGEAIFADNDVFASYFDTVAAHADQPNFTLFNLVALHDGNASDNAREQKLGHNDFYRVRAARLLDEVAAFEQRLAASDRPALLIFVPEHGAALRGDKIQMARLRDIPSPSLTGVPVYLKLFNLPREHGTPQLITMPGSYLSLGTIIAKALEDNFFAADSTADLQDLTSTLTPTGQVSENSGSVVLRFQNEDYLQLSGRSFTRYPR